MNEINDIPVYSSLARNELSNNFRRNFSTSSPVNYHRPFLYTSTRTRVLLRKFSRRRENRNFFVSLNGAENQANDIVDEELKLLEISLTQKREDAGLG